MVKLGKYIGENAPVRIDLDSLIDSRLLIQANSGGGKSYCLRRLMEVCHNRIQQIVLDMEGEFFTLREKYDFLLVGNVKDGADLQISIKTAEILASKILELGISVIIDLYELKTHERILFVKRFLEALINAPKKLWHPCLVYVDEAHRFAPEKRKCESTDAVINLMSQGRKRGFCGVVATQRISKLHKDVCADANNYIVGRSSLDVDMKRSSEILGFTSKEQMYKLRVLDAGEFFAFGTAISKVVKFMKVDRVVTTHPKRGDRIFTKSTAPTDKIKKMLNKLIDLPQVAERELKSKEDMKKEIHRLRMENRKLDFDLKKKKPEVDNGQLDVSYNKGHNIGYNEAVKEGNLKIKELMNKVKPFDMAFTKIARIVSEFKDVKFTGFEVKPVVVKTSIQNRMPHPVTPSEKPVGFQGSEMNVVGNGKVSGGAMRMLKACAMFFPKEITKARMGAIAGLSFRSGSFGTYLATLKRNGLIEQIDTNHFRTTDEGMEVAGDVEPLPSDPQALIGMWVRIVGENSGAGRMLKILGEVYPESLTKEELGERANISHTSGSFGTYLAKLKRNGLIKVVGQNVQASGELFE